MKTKTLGLAALLAAATLSVGVGVHTLSAAAETMNGNGATIYTSAEKDYWMITSGSGDYTVSLDNTGDRFPTYKGVETVVTSAEGVSDIGITLKGMVNPMENMIIAHDNQAAGIADANAIVYTFTSLTDPDRQISIIATHRSNRSWYTFAFTDELELKDSYTYIEGTDQKTIGYRDLSFYDTLGYCAWGAGEYNWGAIYEGQLECKLDTNGNIYYNRNTVIGCMKDESFLALSKANLAGTKYEERYTSEWITETLSQLSDGARMELKWYDLQTDKVDFHIRGISGSWIGDNGENGLQTSLAVQYSTIIYKKTNTLYVGETYKLSDLLYGGGFTFRNAENAGAPLSLSGWYANSVNQTAGDNSTSTWYNGLTQMNKTICWTETGTYNITLSGSFLGFYHSSAFTTNFTFDVVEKTKVIYSFNGTSSDSIPVERWTDITIADLTEEQRAAIPDGFVCDGWKSGESTYAAGTMYTVNGSGADVVFTAVLKDVQKPVITVADDTNTYYDGDEWMAPIATVTDNSNESLTANVTLWKDGEEVTLAENKATLSAGTYTVRYTAKDSSGNEENMEKTVTVKAKIAVIYKLGETTLKSEVYRPSEITLLALTNEQIPAGYNFTGWHDGATLITDTTYTLGESAVTFTAQLQAIEYKAKLVYLDSTKEDDVITFTIENRTEKLQTIKDKLPTPNNGYGNSWKDLPNELPLQNVTYKETECAIEYTITFAGVEGIDPIKFTVENKADITLPTLEVRDGYTAAWDKTLDDITLASITITAQYTAIEYTATVIVNGQSTTITYTIENRAEKLAVISAMKPVADNEYYTYVWETDLPETLPLENGKVYKVVKQNVVKPDSSSSVDSSDSIDSSSDDSSNADSESSSSEDALTTILSSCMSSIDGGFMAMVSVALCGAAIWLLKKKEHNENE